MRAIGDRPAQPTKSAIAFVEYGVRERYSVRSDVPITGDAVQPHQRAPRGSLVADGRFEIRGARDRGNPVSESAGCLELGAGEHEIVFSLRQATEPEIVTATSSRSRRL